MGRETRMRILWLTHRDSLHPLRGGAERTVFEVSRRLARRGHEVIWFSVAPPNSKAEDEHEGIRLLRVRGNLAAHFAIPWVISEVRPDAMVQDLAHVVPWLPDRFSAHPGTAFFHHLHARTLSGQVRNLDAMILRFVESKYAWTFRNWPFVTESWQSAHDLEMLGIPPDRVRRIPPGVDLEMFRPRKKSPVPTLFYFAGFRNYKRPWIALEVLKLVLRDHKDARLVFAGDGPYLERVRSLVHEPLKSKVVFLGRVPDADLAARLAEAWIHLYTSSSEGWGVCTLEAAAAGTPTVAFSVPGLRESVAPGVSGELAPDNDVQTMGTICSSILSQPAAISSRCRAYAGGFTWERAAVEWERHLTHLQG